MDFYQEETSTIQKAVCWVVDIVVMISLAWFVVRCFGGQVRIAGQSMSPLLESGDVVLINRLAYDLGKPKRFDVVVFSREDKRTNVKRVIGLPGETVQIAEGLLYINNRPLDAEGELGSVSLAGLAEEPVVLEEDEYFLLGDNRDGSEDSRFSNIGNVKRAQIQGKVWFRALPLVNIGLIK